MGDARTQRHSAPFVRRPVPRSFYHSTSSPEMWSLAERGYCAGGVSAERGYCAGGHSGTRCEVCDPGDYFSEHLAACTACPAARDRRRPLLDGPC